MFGRTVLSLISSPAYGLLVALATLPVTLIGNFVLAMFGVTAILLPFLVLIVAFLVQVAIYVQTARYAGSFTSLIGITKQPDFFGAIGKGLMVSFLGQIIYFLVMGAVTLIFLEYRGGEALWWLNPEKLKNAMEVAMRQPDRVSGIFSFEGFDLDGLLLTLRVTYMVFMTMLAIFMVPIACGLRWGSERTYNIGLILVRFLIAMPFLAAMVGVIGHLIVAGLDFVIASVWEKVTIALFVRFGVELALFAGMIFSFEALLLRNGAEQEKDEEAMEEVYNANAHDEIRALRQSRMHR